MKIHEINKYSYGGASSETIIKDAGIKYSISHIKDSIFIYTWPLGWSYCRETLNSLAFNTIVYKDIESRWDVERNSSVKDLSNEFYLTVTTTISKINKFLKHLHLIDDLEKKLSLEESSLYVYREGKCGKLIFNLNRYWRNNLITFNIFTLIIRDLCYLTHKKVSLDNYLSGNAPYISHAPLTLGQVFNRSITIDLLYFLKNISLILGEDLITGLDDKKYKESLFNTSYRYLDPNSPYYEYFPVYFDEGVVYTLNKNFHSNIGILTLLKNIQILRLKGKLDRPTYGSGWAINFIKLERGLLNVE